MKIGNVGVTSTPLTSQPQTDGIAGAGEQTSPPGVSTATTAYTPSTELTKLVALVRQEPEVRSDRVLAATQRLQQGDYHTSAAADQTAAAMLGDISL